MSVPLLSLGALLAPLTGAVATPNLPQPAPASEAPLVLTLETRLRYENLSEDAGIGVSAPIRDDYLWRRALVGADWHVDRHVRLLGQLGYHDVVGKKGAVTATEESGADIQQAFVEYQTPRLTLRAGRQEMPFGSQRLVSRRDGPNIRQSFDAVRFDYGRVTAFVGHPVRIGSQSFDDAANLDQTLSGIYASLDVPQLRGMHADLYALRLERKTVRFVAGTVNEDRTSFGLRLSGSHDAFDYDVEAVMQGGTFGAQTIRAHYVSAHLGYTLADTNRVRLGFKFDQATGDDTRRSLRTFNPLFPRGSYFGEAGRFGPANLVRYGSYLSFKPVASLAVEIGADGLWRHRVNDAVYRQPNIPIAGTAGQAGRYTGTQAFAGATWQMTPKLSLTAQMSRVEVSSGLNAVGVGDSRNFGTWLIWRA